MYGSVWYNVGLHLILYCPSMFRKLNYNLFSFQNIIKMLNIAELHVQAHNPMTLVATLYYMQLMYT